MTRTLDYRPEHGLYLYHYGEVFDGVQYVFKFTNGFGASVVKFRGTYGYQNDKWELAVIKFDTEHSFDLVYNTDITDDVIGNLSDDEVNKLLDRIKNLDKNGHDYVEEDDDLAYEEYCKNDILTAQKLVEQFKDVKNIMPSIFYLCNREDPDCPKTHCNPEECSHTLNIKYAKNFKVDEKGNYWEVDHETEQD